MTTHFAPACSQVLPVKPQGVWARGVEAWAGSRDESGVFEVGVFRALQPNDMKACHQAAKLLTYHIIYLYDLTVVQE